MSISPEIKKRMMKLEAEITAASARAYSEGDTYRASGLHAFGMELTYVRVFGTLRVKHGRFGDPIEIIDAMDEDANEAMRHAASYAGLSYP